MKRGAATDCSRNREAIDAPLTVLLHENQRKRKRVIGADHGVANCALRAARRRGDVEAGACHRSVVAEGRILRDECLKLRKSLARLKSGARPSISALELA